MLARPIWFDSDSGPMRPDPMLTISASVLSGRTSGGSGEWWDTKCVASSWFRHRRGPLPWIH
eukprot:9493765-Pyramimonas_sp.AAC.1